MAVLWAVGRTGLSQQGGQRTEEVYARNLLVVETPLHRVKRSSLEQLVAPHLGHLEAVEANIDSAIVHYEAALEIAEAEEDFEGTVVARWGLAEMARAIEDRELELQHLSQVMTGFMQLGRSTPDPIKDRLNELADSVHGGS